MSQFFFCKHLKLPMGKSSQVILYEGNLRLTSLPAFTSLNSTFETPQLCEKSVPN